MHLLKVIISAKHLYFTFLFNSLKPFLNLFYVLEKLETIKMPSSSL